MLFSARKSLEERENPTNVQLFSNLFIRDHGCAPIEELRDPNLEFVSCSDWFQLSLRAQERPATLILTVISGFRITRACHVYNRDAETGN